MIEIPQFLRKYEIELDNYKREFIKIVAIPVEELSIENEIGISKSKFLGNPIYPIIKEYPCDRNSKPMVMVAQLNFEEIPHLDNFPKSGILQLFLSATDWYDEDSKIIYHANQELQGNLISDFSFLSKDLYAEIPVYKTHVLSFEKQIDNGGSEDSHFDFLFGDNDYWDFVNKLSETEKIEFEAYFDASGHKIGGYAEFTQSDPREYDENKKEDIQLLQIDTDDHIMFGDSGLGHVFISKENLIRLDFSKAYFCWDCC